MASVLAIVVFIGLWTPISTFYLSPRRGGGAYTQDIWKLPMQELELKVYSRGLMRKGGGA
jgi:hypothetical protein